MGIKKKNIRNKLIEETKLKKVEGHQRKTSQDKPLMPVGNYSYQFFICCPRDCVSRLNGGTSGAPLKPLRVDSALRALSTLSGLRGAPEVPPLYRQTQSLGQQMLNATMSN